MCIWRACVFHSSLFSLMTGGRNGPKSIFPAFSSNVLFLLFLFSSFLFFSLEGLTGLTSRRCGWPSIPLRGPCRFVSFGIMKLIVSKARERERKKRRFTVLSFSHLFYFLVCFTFLFFYLFNTFRLYLLTHIPFDSNYVLYSTFF